MIHKGGVTRCIELSLARSQVLTAITAQVHGKQL